MWRGAPLADLAYEPFAQREIARLDDLRARALELLIEAKLALGGHAEVIPELEALIAEHPYREHPRAQLMLALTAAIGRRTRCRPTRMHAGSWSRSLG
jgi:DNA-binding SARP family transcriptional activator